MATESELRREIADERRELTNAVDSLQEELGKTAERAKKIGAAVGAVVGAGDRGPDGAANPAPLPGELGAQHGVEARRERVDDRRAHRRDVLVRQRPLGRAEGEPERERPLSLADLLGPRYSSKTSTLAQQLAGRLADRGDEARRRGRPRRRRRRDPAAPPGTGSPPRRRRPAAPPPRARRGRARTRPRRRRAAPGGARRASPRPSAPPSPGEGSGAVARS